MVKNYQAHSLAVLPAGIGAIPKELTLQAGYNNANRNNNPKLLYCNC
jgi:hypothetical protein